MAMLASALTAYVAYKVVAFPIAVVMSVSLMTNLETCGTPEAIGEPVCAMSIPDALGAGATPGHGF